MSDHESQLSAEALEAMARVLGADQVPFRCCTTDLPVPVDAPPDEDEERCCDDWDELSSHYHCPDCHERVSLMGHACSLRGES